MRLDKFLCDCGLGSRSQVKDRIRAGAVKVNGIVTKRPEWAVTEEDSVTVGDVPCRYRRYAYYMLHKPKGVVSATRDEEADTVLSLLPGVGDKNLFPAGRLDKDTTGLLLITNDGELAHRLLSPKRHVNKTYLAEIARELTEEEIRRLEEGLEIGGGERSLPAKVERIGERRILLTIQEGKFHQVKRMLLAVGNEVTNLKRISFGPLVLDEGLAPGAFREITLEELRELYRAAGLDGERDTKAGPM